MYTTLKNRAVLLSLIGCFLLGSAGNARGQNNTEGFVPIFDGKTLDGWEGDPAYWRVEGGNLVGEVTPETILQRNTFIIWRGGAPADFELVLEFRISRSGNSGINYRSEEIADLPLALTGYQCDINGSHSYTGQNYEERGRTTLAYRGQRTEIPLLSGADAEKPLQELVARNAWTKTVLLGSLDEVERSASLLKVEDWNTCRVVAKGNRLLHFVNGLLMSDVTDNDIVNRKAKGLIGVQVHVGPPMKVEYRNILLKQE